MASELVRQLVDAGIHFGHRASRWNPKMSPYIFGKRNTIHIIDIRETVKGLLRAKRFISQTVAGGGDVLFVGTKRQARDHIRLHADRVSMPYVAERWLGGTLTNFRTIRSRLARLEELEAAEADGTSLEYSKKMIASRARETRKIRRNLEGIRKMSKLPKLLIVVDVRREANAVREAKKLKIPTICLIDTDSDPDFADVPIPGNDDAMRAIDVVLDHLAGAVEEGIKGRTAPEPDEAAPPPRRRSRRTTTARAEGGEGGEALGSPGEAPPTEVAKTESTSGAPGVASSSDPADTRPVPAAATEPDAPIK